MQRGRMRAEAQSNAEQRRATQSNAGSGCVHLLYHALGSRFRSLSRGCEDWNEAQRAPASPAHSSFPSTSSQMLLHTQCCICPATACLVHVCLPSLCSNRPRKISFLPDRRLSRAIDTSSAHAPAQSYRSRHVQTMEIIITVVATIFYYNFETLLHGK
jgi:hypothetical protein